MVVVLDVSGSMSHNASMPGSENIALTQLDVVKHATKTVAELLDERDNMSLVTFSEVASVIFGPQAMTPTSRAQVDAILNRTGTQGRTNLWAGIEAGLQSLLRTREMAQTTQCGMDNVNCILLLTDGEPNMHPATGEVQALKAFRAQHPDLQFHLMSMALGFDNQASDLLSELSTVGNGAYTYIPDSGMVGSVFVNAMSSLFCVAAQEIVIKVAAPATRGQLEIEPTTSSSSLASSTEIYCMPTLTEVGGKCK